MNSRVIFCLIFLLFNLQYAFSKDADLERLDDAISRRDIFINAKQTRMDSLYRLTRFEHDKEGLLDLYEKLFQEYLTFNFDSAMLYVERADKLVGSDGSYDKKAAIEIHRALSLATSGHFSHAINILDHIDSKQLNRNMQEEYFSACEWTYGVWAEYAHKDLASDFTKKSLVYLDSLISISDTSSPEYTYRLAERNLRKGNFKAAEQEYRSVLDRIPRQTRLYAQAAYALALTYKSLDNKPEYRKWLINAAISDQEIPLKENLALQQLAMYLNKEEGDLERANSFLKLALEDAIFYNNRLRMLEIAEKIPDIANVYQDTINSQNRRLKVYILVIGILILVLGMVTILIYRQRQAMTRSRNALSELNKNLHLLNSRLNQTNKSREEYVSLFLDLCVTYIDKLNRFPTYIKMKVNQLSELNSVADKYVRPTESETREMFKTFDTAFLRLYPNFITEFNNLLQPDRPVIPKKGELLNTDLRIYALVRMGISDSNKIATLLFLSPQTIFNHRTQIRNRAKDRAEFEQEIANLCAIE